jgi:hypothetical protein
VDKHALAEKETMAKVTSVIVAAAIVAVSIATPALAAHKGKPITAHQNGHVTRSRQGSGVYAPALPSDYDPGARSYDGWM